MQIQTNLKALWAKKPKTDDSNQSVVSLQDHLKKTADIAKTLYDTWLPNNLKKQIFEM